MLWPLSNDSDFFFFLEVWLNIGFILFLMYGANNAYQKIPCQPMSHTHTNTHCPVLFLLIMSNFSSPALILCCHTLFLLTDRNKTHVIGKTLAVPAWGTLEIYTIWKKKKSKYRTKKCFVQKYIFMKKLFVKCMNLLCTFSKQCKIKKRLIAFVKNKKYLCLYFFSTGFC